MLWHRSQRYLRNSPTLAVRSVSELRMVLVRSASMGCFLVFGDAKIAHFLMRWRAGTTDRQKHRVRRCPQRAQYRQLAPTITAAKPSHWVSRAMSGVSWYPSVGTTAGEKPWKLRGTLFS